MYLKYFKRPLDILAALLGLLILSPIFILVSLFLILFYNHNPFFLQNRGGFKGSVFKIIKFKTMNDKKDADGQFLPDNMRLTKLGKFLRKHSIDELPQLINVLKGDMSLIGPRPFHSSYLKLYSTHQSKRHNVVPGITGWAQINGRNSIKWSEKFDLDIYYTENRCFKLDLYILIKTFKKVVLPSNINRSEETTASMFNGKN